MARVNAQTRSPSLLSYTFTSPSSDPNLYTVHSSRADLWSAPGAVPGIAGPLGTCRAGYSTYGRSPQLMSAPVARAPARDRHLYCRTRRCRFCTTARRRARPRAGERPAAAEAGRLSTSPRAPAPA